MTHMAAQGVQMHGKVIDQHNSGCGGARGSTTTSGRVPMLQVQSNKTRAIVLDFVASSVEIQIINLQTVTEPLVAIWTVENNL